MKRLPINPDCEICREIKSGRFPEPYASAYGFSSRDRDPTSEYMTVPSVSPVAAGHMLVFPRHHVTALQALSAAEKSRLDLLVAAVSSKLRVYSSDVLYFEHGTDYGKACGVGHAHLHLVPLPALCLRNILGQLTDVFPESEYGSLPELLSDKPRTAEYLLFGSSVRDMRIAFSDSIESQLIRRLICREIGVPDFDWKSVGNIEGFRTTLQEMALQV